LLEIVAPYELFLWYREPFLSRGLIILQVHSSAQNYWETDEGNQQLATLNFDLSHLNGVLGHRGFAVSDEGILLTARLHLEVDTTTNAAEHSTCDRRDASAECFMRKGLSKMGKSKAPCRRVRALKEAAGTYQTDERRQRKRYHQYSRSTQPRKSHTSAHSPGNRDVSQKVAGKSMERPYISRNVGIRVWISLLKNWSSELTRLLVAVFVPRMNGMTAAVVGVWIDGGW
jgi:hypothetical protein